MTTTLWSWLNYTLRTPSNLDKYSTKIKYRVDMKFNVKSHYLILWPWPWVCMIELCVLHTLAVSWTFYQSVMIILQGFEEIWSIRAIGSLIPLPVTVTLSLRNWVMGSAHRLTEVKFDQSLENFYRFNEIQELWINGWIDTSGSWIYECGVYFKRC